jgi:hypothetical protein
MVGNACLGICSRLPVTCQVANYLHYATSYEESHSCSYATNFATYKSEKLESAHPFRCQLAPTTIDWPTPLMHLPRCQ